MVRSRRPDPNAVVTLADGSRLTLGLDNAAKGLAGNAVHVMGANPAVTQALAAWLKPRCDKEILRLADTEEDVFGRGQFTECEQDPQRPGDVLVRLKFNSGFGDGIGENSPSNLLSEGVVHKALAELAKISTPEKLAAKLGVAYPYVPPPADRMVGETHLVGGKAQRGLFHDE